MPLLSWRRLWHMQAFLANYLRQRLWNQLPAEAMPRALQGHTCHQHQQRVVTYWLWQDIGCLFCLTMFTQAQGKFSCYDHHKTAKSSAGIGPANKRDVTACLFVLVVK